MTSIDVPNTKELIEAVVPGFIDVESLMLGASHSGHGVRFGDYSEDGVNFQRIAAKPYWGRKSPDNSRRELYMTKEFGRRGFDTLESLGVIALTENRDPVDYVAVFMTKYVGDNYSGGNLLTLEEDPRTHKGKVVAEIVGNVACTLARVHSVKATHGDPQLKNFMLFTNNPLERNPIVMDLEKSNIYNNKRNPAVISLPDNFRSGIKRDLIRLSYSLGSRQYGRREAGYFTETVIEPYMEELSNSVKSQFSLVGVISAATESFCENREIQKPKPALE